MRTQRSNAQKRTLVAKQLKMSRPRNADVISTFTCKAGGAGAERAYIVTVDQRGTRTALI